MGPQSLRGSRSAHSSDEYILAQLDEVRRLQDAARSFKWLDMFKGVNLRRFLISAAMPVYAAFIGNNLVFS